MEKNLLGPTYQRFFRGIEGRIEQIISGPHWRLKSLIAVLALSLFRAFPSYDALTTQFVENKWRDVQVKFDHPLLDTSRVFPPNVHESNLTFRLIVPLLAHVFHLNEAGVLILSGVAGLVLLYQTLRIVYSVSGSKPLAFLVCLITASAWPGETAFHELRGGYYDAMALCFLVSAFATSSSALTAAFLFLAIWTDERALIISPFLFQFGLLEGAKVLRRFKSGKPAATLVAVVAYIAARAYLTVAHSYPIRPTVVGLSVLSQQTNVIPLAIWTGLGGGWVLVLVGIIAFVVQKRYLAAIAFSSILAGAITASLTVIDVTRSMAFCLPAVFIALAALCRSETPQEIGRIATFAAVLSYFIPTYYVEGGTGFWWLYPFPIQVIRWLLAFAGVSHL